MKNKAKLAKFIVKFIVKKFGIKVKYEEVGFYNGGYNAVFWIGKKPVDFIKENKIKN